MHVYTVTIDSDRMQKLSRNGAVDGKVRVMQWLAHYLNKQGDCRVSVAVGDVASVSGPDGEMPGALADLDAWLSGAKAIDLAPVKKEAKRAKPALPSKLASVVSKYARSAPAPEPSPPAPEPSPVVEPSPMAATEPPPPTPTGPLADEPMGSLDGSALVNVSRET